LRVTVLSHPPSSADDASQPIENKSLFLIDQIVRSGENGLTDKQLAWFLAVCAQRYPQLLWISHGDRKCSQNARMRATIAGSTAISHIMNYRHHYHAGNFADVTKHIVLVTMLRALCAKPKPFFYLDTHAGLGLYDLRHPHAQKTQEYRLGIERVRHAQHPPAAVADYLSLISTANAGEPEVTLYPGSPWLATQILRPHDRAAMIELHQEDITTLRQHLQRDTRIGVHHDNGYTSLKALLPPKEKRGLVFIDPPYEQPNEYGQLVRALIEAHARWPQGIYLIWYPIKARHERDRFHRQLIATGLRKIWFAEQRVCADDLPNRLNGSGIIALNPPYQTDETIELALQWLTPQLAQQGGSYQAGWLVPE
jgi:23S rRNA (adenine2030-N6)-methyltransferase